MEEFNEQEEVAFNAEDINVIIKESVERVLSAAGGVYDHAQAAQWDNAIIESTLKSLVGLGKPYKYIVTCTIMQKTGAGLHSATASYWDNSTDGSCTYRYESKTLYCITTVYCLSI